MPTGTLAQSQSVCSSEEIKVHGWSGAILRVVGWVQDAAGRVSITAESICLSEEAE